MRWEVPAAGVGERAAAMALAAQLESMRGLAPAASEQRVVIEPPAEAPVTPVPAPAVAPVPPPTPIAPITAEAAPATLPPHAPPPASTVPVLPPPDAGDAVVGDLPTVPAGPVQAPRPPPRKPPEPKIFIPPRAPDDPGTGASDLDDLQGYPTKA
jgi:hypothetical protein